MATSQNGYPASGDRSSIDVKPFVVEGVDFPGGVKAGPVATVLGYVVEQVHRRVEKLHPGWCWGHAYRDVRGSTDLSNHASGTAVDVNAPDHPIGSYNTFNAVQRSEIRKILDEVRGTVRWGGDYAGRPDDMHFEINSGSTEVQAAATALESEGSGFLSSLTDSQQADVYWRIMNHLPAYVNSIKADVNEHKPFLVQEVGKPAVYVSDGTGVEYRRVHDSVELGYLENKLGPVRTYQAGTLGVLGVFRND